MSALANKIRKAREFTRTIEGWNLRLRRPTDAEAAKIIGREQADALEVATTYVIGWEAVTEADLVKSGSSDPVAFDADVWAEVVADTPALWEPISTAVIDAWVSHNDKREDRSKN